MLRELFARLGLDDLISILYSITVRLALRGQLTRDDVAQIRAAIGEATQHFDRAA